MYFPFFYQFTSGCLWPSRLRIDERNENKWNVRLKIAKKRGKNQLKRSIATAECNVASKNNRVED